MLAHDLWTQGGNEALARSERAPWLRAVAPAGAGGPRPLVTSRSYRRAALAVAEMLLPGSSRVPFADESTVARVEEVLAEFDPRAPGAWRAAVRTLDLAAVASTGRTLHALSPDAQDALLRRWEHDPVLCAPLTAVATLLKLVHFDQPAVYGRLGGRLNVVRQLEQPRWLSGVHPAATWSGDDVVECDVVVVGTGAGGAVVGRELAERGHAVVFVEEGEHHRRDAFDGSSVRAHQRFYRAALAVGNVAMPVFAGRLVGGSTAINTGTCFRTPPWVLDRWCEELGTDDFSPAAMERHFARVESRIHVAPAPLDKVGPLAGIMARGCDALGWSHGPVDRNAPGCTGEGFCDFGCRTGARQSTDLSYVPAAIERGAIVLTGLRADRVLVEDGRAVGVLGVTSGGREIRVRARAVVLAGGAIPTPGLLLRQGLANGSDAVGRHLKLQPSAGFAALFDEEVDAQRYIPQGYKCDAFARDGEMIMTAQVDVNYTAMLLPFSGRRLMDVLDRQRHLGAFALLLAESSSEGRVHGTVGGYPAIQYDVSPHDARRMHALMTRTGELCVAAGARTLFPGTRTHPILDGARDLERFGEAKLGARDLAWISYHPLGTCKMGRDPRTSVVGLDHQTHDVERLYVVDGSTVPGALGVNPQMTIMAMATRAAEGIDAAL